MSLDPRSFQTFVEAIRRRAEHDSERRAVTYLRDGEQEVTAICFGELDRRARAIAGLLRERGIAPGERALVLQPQTPEYLTAFLGCLYAGVIAVPLYPPHPNRPERTLPKLRAVARDCCAAAALVSGDGMAAAEAVGALAPELAALRWLATDEVSDDLADGWREPAVSGETVALLQYTSGSTAAPKGVIVSHSNLVHNELMLGTAWEHDESSTLVSWLPLFHDMGLIAAALQALFFGAEAVLMPPVTFAQRPVRWLQAISRYRGRTSGAPNFGYDLCVRKVTPEQRAELDLSNWHVAFSGAEPIRRRTLEEFAVAFGSSGFRPTSWHPCYGLAEITVFASGGRCQDPPIVCTLEAEALERDLLVEAEPEAVGRALVGCGRAWLDRRIEIVDPQTCRRLPPDRVGEIWLAGADVAQGYWGRPEESEHTFRAHLADTGEGPFLRTGDLGFVKDGELFIAGRLKDLVIIAGRNHYPQDIELTVEDSHAGVRPGCSVTFSVEVDGQERLVVVAEVEREYRPGAGEDPRAVAWRLEAIIRAIRRAVAEEHDVRVHDVVLIRPGSIPKTSSGKLQRSTCRAGLLTGQLDAVILARSAPAAGPSGAGRDGRSDAAEGRPVAVGSGGRLEGRE